MLSHHMQRSVVVPRRGVQWLLWYVIALSIQSIFHMVSETLPGRAATSEFVLIGVLLMYKGASAARLCLSWSSSWGCTARVCRSCGSCGGTAAALLWGLLGDLKSTIASLHSPPLHEVACGWYGGLCFPTTVTLPLPPTQEKMYLKFCIGFHWGRARGRWDVFWRSLLFLLFRLGWAL